MGFVSFLLHGHLPYVNHPEKDSFLEEDWFNEAMAEVYIPLAIMLDNLNKKNLKNQFTLSLSPTLLAMMSNDDLIKKFVRYLNQRIDFLQTELDNYIQFDQTNEQLKPAYALLKKYNEIKLAFTTKYNFNIISEFKRLKENGVIEIITTSMTHTFSPNFMPYKNYLHLQIKCALDEFESFFGYRPIGFWLPECGYFEGLEDILLKNGLKYTIIEAHGILMGEDLPKNGVYAPVYAKNGFVFFPRDIDSAKNVWSRTEGYPASEYYRDFHKDIGTNWNDNRVYKMLHKNIDNEYIKSFTGIKYWQIGEDENGQKKIYDPFIAKEMTKYDAEDFVNKRINITEKVLELMDKPPLFTAPYDMELFGHWWFEGIDFLKNISLTSSKNDTIKLTTFDCYLQEFKTHQLLNPKYSTWGQNGFSQVWNNDSNNKIIINSHKILEKFEQLMKIIFSEKIILDSLEKEAVVLLTKIVFLLTSSDWPFLINSGICAYPTKRFYIHNEEFEFLLKKIIENNIEKEDIQNLNRKYPLFYNIKYEDLEIYNV